VGIRERNIVKSLNREKYTLGLGGKRKTWKTLCFKKWGIHLLKNKHERLPPEEKKPRNFYKKRKLRRRWRNGVL